MEVRTGKYERSRGLILAFALIAPALLAGCSTTPRTEFEWGVNDRYHYHHTATVPVPTPRHYVYHAPVYHEAAYQPAIVPTPRPAPGWYQPAPRPAQSDTIAAPSDGDVHFSWPTSGHVISDYGAMDNGARNDGINIAAPNGQPIRASADGTVSYSGNDLKSYGNLVLVRHGDNYVTAYAHAERIAVNRGDHVVKGQIIAYVGNTGDVSEPQLHFEIRHGVHAVDPRPLLGPLVVASR